TTTGESQASIGWRDVQQRLAPDEAAVEFVAFPIVSAEGSIAGGRYVALVLTAQATTGPVLVDLGDARDLTAAFADYARVVLATADPADRSPGLAARSGFYDAVWKPLEPALAGRRRVYLATDGLLTQVSWAPIADSDGRLLMDHYDLRLVSTTRDLARHVQGA